MSRRASSSAGGTTTLPPGDPRIEWRGVVEVEHGPDWSRAWRLPSAGLSRYGLVGLGERALMPAGVRLVFRTTSTTVGIRLAPGWDDDGDALPVDLVVDGQRAGSSRPDRDGRAGFGDLGAGPKQVELWLPQFGQVRVTGVELERACAVERPPADRRRRLVTHGSSITQCRTAPSPTSTWPALLAEQLDLQLTCLGFGGECHADPLVARTVAALPADLIVLCMGINMYTGASLSARTLAPAVTGFVETVRDGHPTAPIHLITPISSPDREDVPNAVGLTLSQVRTAVEAVGRRLREAGDQHLHLIDGRSILGPSDARLLADGLHPDATGYALMARRLATQLAAEGGDRR